MCQTPTILFAPGSSGSCATITRTGGTYFLLMGKGTKQRGMSQDLCSGQEWMGGRQTHGDMGLPIYAMGKQSLEGRYG